MIKVYDCSNSSCSSHTGQGGPVMNDVMRQLRTRFPFVNDPRTADVIITNDIFPSNVPNNIPRVKRMDGSFWMQQNLYRNFPLDLAANYANAIVYISEYSKSCHIKRGFRISKDQKYYVAVNKANPEEFPKRNVKKKEYTSRWIAVASNWNRPEKKRKIFN